VDGIARLLASDFHDPVNLGNPDEVSILDFAKEILQLTGSTSAIAFKPLPQDDPRVRRPDIDRARRLLGWEPRVSRPEGLRRTVEHFRTRI
jgi:dTDP-glucose 4,6-dehydratase